VRGRNCSLDGLFFELIFCPCQNEVVIQTPHSELRTPHF
jgi:hypothetical protein